MKKDATISSDKDLAQIESKRQKNPGYYGEVDRTCTFVVPEGFRVLELGCATGRLLAAVRPSYGLGIDIDTEQIEAARQIHADHSNLEFQVGDIEEMDFSGIEPFDYIIISDVLPLLRDVQKTLSRLRSACVPYTRLIITYHSNLWRPILALATLLGRRAPDPSYNWLSTNDIENLLDLSGFEEVTHSGRTLLPVRIPGLSWIMNRLLAKMPIFNWFCLTWIIVARPSPQVGLKKEYGDEPTVSIVIPTRNEKGNIEEAFTRTPKMGKWTELIFVDANSDDGTIEEINRCIEKYGGQWHRVLLLHQSGEGKGQAVRQGFAECRGDVLMILDSDLTMPPEELSKYYEAIVRGKGEFINGCRLVYPMEKKAMRFLNMVANHFFAQLFTWLLGQRVKDTLCGTKVLWRRDYERIAANRSYFGDFDPFGDFDLLFGASRLNYKIIDMPIRDRERSYGEIKISRWQHGWLLLRMSVVAFRKLKLS
ncbi:MAG: bifunctional class I SAM-dependent methyltransferase/glycosyltransferase family 2 protein [Sedimentisphaerales bacterium]|nr:bifunctional class I SAM-dependent methyltransferase/glycosyltransferase family 2 protein [Sedimentisphaerales bacterium]